MSDISTPSTSNINNSIYQFDISLINTTKGKETKLSLPKGAVEYLEIEDNLANFGLVGKCRIVNFYGILQQLNILVSTEVQHIFIDISNTDFKNSGIEDNADIRLSLFATLQQGAEISQNIISKSINYTFEEYYVASMRKQSIINLLPVLETTKGPPGRLIYDILYKLNKTSTSELSKLANFNNEFMLDDEVPNSIALSDIYTGGKVASVFDVVSDLYNFVTFQSNGSGNSSGGPAIISSTNKLVDGVVKRLFTLQPLSHLTSGFYERIQQNAEDLSNYVTEEFVVGNSTTGNAPNTNFIDNYALITTNYDDVMSKKWIDYTLSEIKALDPTVSIQADIAYEDVKYDFSKEMLNGANPNLPDRSGEDRIMTAQIKKKVSDDLLTKQYTQNSLKKSFVLDNIALTFTVPGNTYRKTGKFVKINAPKTEVLGGDSISGYWLVILLKHVFDGDYYTNEYTCVRLHTAGMMLPPSFVDQANITQSGLFSNPLLDNFKEQSEPELPGLPTKTEYQDQLDGAISTTAIPNNNGSILPPLGAIAPNTNSNTFITPETEMADPSELLDFINKQ